MSSPLEKFILENRDKFDTDTPDPQLWEKLNDRMHPQTKKAIPFRSAVLKRWLAVAASLLLVTLTSILYYTTRDKKSSSIIAEKTVLPNKSNNLPTTIPSADSSHIAQTQANNQPNKNQESLPGIKEDSPDKKSDESENKEMYYYAKLIEIKHEELKTLEKDEPLLYKQFSGDVQRLDSVYHSLKTQLPTNSNREQVIEAMISNLQLQIGLLNKQLDIIKKIKHFKKTAYEKAYKSV
jgi:hypothetical protein